MCSRRDTIMAWMGGLAMQVPGFGELLLIAGFALIIFGPRRLPEIGRALGRGIREFRNAVKDVTGEADGDAAPKRRWEREPM